MTYDEKIVSFDVWCPKCKHKSKGEDEDPCWHCLDEPVSTYGQPVEYEEA